MVKLRNKIALLILALLCMGSTQSPIQLPQTRQDQVAVIANEIEIQSGELVLEIDPGSSIEDINDRNGTITKRHIQGTSYYKVQVPVGHEIEFRNNLSIDPDVSYAAFNPVMYSPYSVSSRSVMGFPGDTAEPGLSAAEYESQRTSLERYITLDQAQLRSTGADKTVAVIDTGIDPGHPAVASHLHSYGKNLIEGEAYDTSERAADPATTVAGHGTFIAGLIALIAPDCRIMVIKAFSPLGESDEFTVAEAIKEAADHGADVINLSCGTRDDSRIIRDAVTYARQHGAILVAAVGNNATDQIPEYPASIIDGVLGVASIELDDTCSPFSNFGWNVSLAAYGRAMISSYPGGTYARWSGTSFATPLISAEAILVLGADPSSRTTRKVVEATAVDVSNLNPEKHLGYGRLNPRSALHALSTNPIIKPTVDLNAQIELANTLFALTSSGSAEISLIGSSPELRVRAFGLKPTSRYSCTVDGVRLREGYSSPFGGFEWVFGNGPTTTAAPGRTPTGYGLPSITSIGQIEVRDSFERIVLSGRFVPVSGPTVATQMIRKELRFQAASAPTSSLGLARVEIRGAVQRLRVNLEGLTDGRYQIEIDGVSAGAANASRGFLGVDNVHDGSDSLVLPPSMISVVNIHQIRILNSLGIPVAFGTFRFPGGNIGNR